MNATFFARRQTPPALLVSLFFILLLGCGCQQFTPAPAKERTVEVSLLLRRNYTTDTAESRMVRHLDILLADGRIVAFHPHDESIKGWRKLFLRHEGEVREYNLIKRYNPEFIDASVAADCKYKDQAHMKLVTWQARIRVTPAQAERLTACWDELKQNPPIFRLWGSNCATRGTEALACAGILPSGLPGFDTPGKVLERVQKFYPDIIIDEGYFGYDEQMRPFLAPLPQKGDGK